MTRTRTFSLGSFARALFCVSACIYILLIERRKGSLPLASRVSRGVRTRCTRQLSGSVQAIKGKHLTSRNPAHLHTMVHVPVTGTHTVNSESQRPVFRVTGCGGAPRTRAAFYARRIALVSSAQTPSALGAKLRAARRALVAGTCRRRLAREAPRVLT